MKIYFISTTRNFACYEIAYPFLEYGNQIKQKVLNMHNTYQIKFQQ